jgi:hypothetical protein
MILTLSLLLMRSKCDLSGCSGPGEGETEDNTRAAIKCR